MAENSKINSLLRKATPSVRRLNKHLLTGPQPVATSVDGAARCSTVNKNAVVSPSTDVPKRTKRVVVIPVNPMGAPRMTRADGWKKRPVVLRYWEYCNQIRLAAGPILGVPDSIKMRFYIAMPDSWSKKKKSEMCHEPHRSTPDFDNITKGVMDALFENDAGIWRSSQVKFWEHADAARIKLEVIYD